VARRIITHREQVDAMGELPVLRVSSELPVHIDRDRDGHPDLAWMLQVLGCAHSSCGRRLGGHHHHLAAFAGFDDPKGWQHHVSVAPFSDAVEGARGYASQFGYADPHDGHDYTSVMQTPDAMRSVGQAYDALPDFDEGAVPHWEAMRNEINNQYDHAVNTMGITPEFVDHDPYSDVHEMMDDLNTNRRLQVLRTGVTGSHPFFTDEENDRFRFVHDLFGHAATGRGFDRHGEQASYLAHSRMFSPQAQPALATETRGQNSSLILNGAFAPQKIAVMDPAHWRTALRYTAAPHMAYDPQPGFGTGYYSRDKHDQAILDQLDWEERNADALDQADPLADLVAGELTNPAALKLLDLLQKRKPVPARTAAVDPFTGLWREEESMPPADLHLSPEEVAGYFNPYNDISPAKMESLRRTVGDDGIRSPVQIDTDGIHARLNDGHHRVTLAQERGFNQVPVILNRVDEHFFKRKKPEAAPLIQPSSGLRAHLGSAPIRSAAAPNYSTMSVQEAIAHDGDADNWVKANPAIVKQMASDAAAGDHNFRNYIGNEAWDMLQDSLQIAAMDGSQNAFDALDDHRKQSMINEGSVPMSWHSTPGSADNLGTFEEDELEPYDLGYGDEAYSVADDDETHPDDPPLNPAANDPLMKLLDGNPWENKRANGLDGFVDEADYYDSLYGTNPVTGISKAQELNEYTLKELLDSDADPFLVQDWLALHPGVDAALKDPKDPAHQALKDEVGEQLKGVLDSKAYPALHLQEPTKTLGQELHDSWGKQYLSSPDVFDALPPHEQKKVLLNLKNQFAPGSDTQLSIDEFLAKHFGEGEGDKQPGLDTSVPPEIAWEMIEKELSDAGYDTGNEFEYDEAFDTWMKGIPDQVVQHWANEGPGSGAVEDYENYQLKSDYEPPSLLGDLKAAWPSMADMWAPNLWSTADDSTKSKLQTIMNMWSGKGHDGFDEDAFRAIQKKWFGDGGAESEQQEPPAFDPDTFVKAYKEAYPNTTFGHHELGTPEKAKQILKGIIEESEKEGVGPYDGPGSDLYDPDEEPNWPTPEDHEQGKATWLAEKQLAQKMYDKYFGDGGGAAEANTKSYSPQKFVDKYKEIFPGSGLFPHSVKTPEQAKQMLQDTLDSIDGAPYFQNGEVDKVKALHDEMFGEGAPSWVAQAPAPTKKPTKHKAPATPEDGGGLTGVDGKPDWRPWRNREPKSLDSPMFSQDDRPLRENSGKDRELQYFFSPNDWNPESTSGARPDIRWTNNDFEEDEVLPGMPTENRSVKLYRGEPIDLRHPDAAHIRDMLFGDHPSTMGYGETKNKNRSQMRLPGMEDLHLDPQDVKGYDAYENPELGPAIAEFWQRTRGKEVGPADPDQGLGRHWTVSPGVTDGFTGGKGTNVDNLAVRFVSDWTGQGEDPYRTNTGGEHPSEREITMIPGSPMNIVDVQVNHPEKGWVSAWPEGLVKTHYSSVPQRRAQGRPIVGHREQVEAMMLLARGPENLDFTDAYMAPYTDEEYQAHLANVERLNRQALKQGLETYETYRDEFGNWTPERADIHRQILDDAWNELAAHIPANRQGMMIGGLPGAGKSTVLKNMGDIPGVGSPKDFLSIDPDYFKEQLVKRGLVPEVEGLSPLEASPLIHEESGHLADQLARRAFENGTNIAFDGTMRKLKSAQDHLAEFESYGYSKPHGLFVDIPLDVSHQRAQARHRDAFEKHRVGNPKSPYGGRVVPADFINGSASTDPQWNSENRLNFETIRPQLASAQVWDNSATGVGGLSQPKRIGNKGIASVIPALV
jgi:hypothetical protein